MKTLLTLLTLFFFYFTAPFQTQIPPSSNNSIPLVEDSVMICDSPNAYAYHIKWCSGLQKCTHDVKKMTLKEARELGFQKPCGFCY